MPAEPAKERRPLQALRPKPPPLNRETVVPQLKGCLDAIIKAAGFNLKYQLQLPDAGKTPEHERAEIIVEFDGPDSDLLLERGAELLQALEHVVVRGIRLEREQHDRISFDCGHYHADRLAELKLSAQVAAERVRESRMPFRFNPMSSRDRRVIHLALQSQAGVRTASEGMGDRRRVVVYPVSGRPNPSSSSR